MSNLCKRIRNKTEPGYGSIYGAYLDGQRMITQGDYKLILPHRYRTLDGGEGGRGGLPVAYQQKTTGTELYNLVADPGETRDLAADMPEKVAELLEHAEAARAELGDKLTDRQGAGSRQPGRLTDDEHTALMKVHWPNGRPQR